MLIHKQPKDKKLIVKYNNFKYTFLNQKHNYIKMKKSISNGFKNIKNFFKPKSKKPLEQTSVIKTKIDITDSLEELENRLNKLKNFLEHFVETFTNFRKLTIKPEFEEININEDEVKEQEELNLYKNLEVELSDNIKIAILTIKTESLKTFKRSFCKTYGMLQNHKNSEQNIIPLYEKIKTPILGQQNLRIAEIINNLGEVEEYVNSLLMELAKKLIIQIENKNHQEIKFLLSIAEPVMDHILKYPKLESAYNSLNLLELTNINETPVILKTEIDPQILFQAGHFIGSFLVSPFLKCANLPNQTIYNCYISQFNINHAIESIKIPAISLALKNNISPAYDLFALRLGSDIVDAYMGKAEFSLKYLTNSLLGYATNIVASCYISQFPLYRDHPFVVGMLIPNLGHLATLTFDAAYELSGKLLYGSEEL
jgi:hypothetical protein